MPSDSTIISIIDPHEKDNLMGIGYRGIYPQKPIVLAYDDGVLYAAPADNEVTIKTELGLYTLMNGRWHPVNLGQNMDFEWEKVEEA